MNKIKVLKLGWEFPPLINGGLGVACHGLSEALSKLVDLHVVLPKADISASYDGYSVSSLHHEGVTKVTKEVKRMPTISYVENPNISPYFSEEGGYYEEGSEEVYAENYRRYGFTIDQLYGDDVGRKVHEFSHALRQCALSYDFDIIHAHDWLTYKAGVALKEETGKPLVVHLHASQYDRAGPGARGWIFDIERDGMMAADLVIPVSDYTGRIARDHYGIAEEKIVTVHNGADVVETFTSEKKFPEKLVLFLGRLTDQKGPEYFLEIASLVLSENPNVRFVMAGTGEKMKGLIETGAFKGLGGRFHFTGFLDKERVNQLLSMTDVYCMPSVSEPFGLSALEAAQFGIPAVISKQSGVAEVLKAALKADFWDTQLMAKHISDLVKDEDLCAEVSAKALTDIKAATWDAAAKKVVDLYGKVLAR